jgi:hypothetical protein
MMHSPYNQYAGKPSQKGDAIVKMTPEMLLAYIMVLSEKYGINVTDLLKVLVETDRPVGEEVSKKYFFEKVDYSPVTDTAYD